VNYGFLLISGLRSLRNILSVFPIITAIAAARKGKAPPIKKPTTGPPAVPIKAVETPKREQL
jgi:hypothetical protein